ncbi:MAG: ATP synthase F1 subunit epsilon [Lachnospiraceae bacterium]|nr:ATP synthase F1 subunit epsilon [Lachnospiraceae bacterium]
MDKTFTLRVIVSDKIFYDGKCVQLIIPATDGAMGILANHENMVVAVTNGDMRIQTEDGSWIEAAIGTGFAQISNNRAMVLADTAERPEEIDEERAKRALERAQVRLRQRQSLQEYHLSQAALSRAMSRLSMSSKYRGH